MKHEKLGIVFEGRVFDVQRHKLFLPDGKECIRDIIEHPGAVVILPRDAEGNLILISQYRHALQDTIIEIPAGTLEEGEAPAVCAEREIQEETGFAAEDWTDLGVIYPSPGICDEKQYCYLAEGLFESKLQGDDDEFIEVEKYSVDEVEHMIVSGQITDAKTIAVFARARFKGVI